MRRAARFLSLLLAALAMLLVGAGYAIGRGDRVPSIPSPGSPAEHLAELTIEPERSSAGYSRDAFGPAWGIPHDGCNARVVVLAEESLTPVTRGPDGCTVTGGRWRSVYDGVEVTDPAELDIDHTVALAEAWESGASDWDDFGRERFANEVSHVDVLIAVTATSNRSKSDSDPAEWLPPDEDAWCGFVEAWITTKWLYRLTVDQAEHDALVDVLAGCPGGAS